AVARGSRVGAEADRAPPGRTASTPSSFSLLKDGTQPFGQSLQIEGPFAGGEGPEPRMPRNRARPGRGPVVRIGDDPETARFPAEVDLALPQRRPTSLSLPYRLPPYP